ncbi:MAG: hypothetical protein KAG53_06565 [Endozoicomonadaceae bacterium]|nr:hypothetical protein [Endozoicomonadaceae bacterium]
MAIEEQVQRKGFREASTEKKRTCNQKIAVARKGEERPFGTYKRDCWLARTRFMGPARHAAISWADGYGRQNLQRHYII